MFLLCFHRHARCIIGESKMIKGVNMSSNNCLSLHSSHIRNRLDPSVFNPESEVRIKDAISNVWLAADMSGKRFACYVLK